MLELEKVRSQGYAVNTGETAEGVTCVAAPIFNNEGRVIAALSISGPSFRMQSALEDLRRGVQQATARLSLLLGYRLHKVEDALIID
jgi:DNA-binding IclR family transcriptional regulator